MNECHLQIEPAQHCRTRVVMFSGVGLAGLDAAHRFLIDVDLDSLPVLVSIRDVHPGAVRARSEFLQLGLARDGDSVASNNRWFIGPDRYCAIEDGQFKIDRATVPRPDSPVSARLCESLRHEFGSQALIVNADPLLVGNVFVRRLVQRGGHLVNIVDPDSGWIDEQQYDDLGRSLAGRLDTSLVVAP